VPGDPQEHRIVIVDVSALVIVSVISDIIVTVISVNIVTATAGFAPRQSQR
jgi:hypothetical protein